jgi:hypothetical protein
MNNQEKYNDDLLSGYINPERIEKAPEGFTSKVMACIEKEKVPQKVAESTRNRSFVPVISVVTTIILIGSVFLIPGKSIDVSTIPVLQLLSNIKITLPEIDLTSFFSFNIPVTLVYGFIGILILSLLDRALYGVFHKRKKV